MFTFGCAKMKNETEESKIRRIPAIKQGIAIDHIPFGNAMKVLDILNIHQDKDSIITVGINLNSSKMGKKDVVKIENKTIKKQELEKISLVAPNATISFISNYKVNDKMIIKIPEFIDDTIKCTNYNCITNHQPVKTKFYKIENKKEIKFKCHYCEKNTSLEEIELK